MSTAMMTRPTCLAARPVAKASAVRRPLRLTSQPRLRTLVRADPTKVPGAGGAGQWAGQKRQDVDRKDAPVVGGRLAPGCMQCGGGAPLQPLAARAGQGCALRRGRAAQFLWPRRKTGRRCAAVTGAQAWPGPRLWLRVRRRPKQDRVCQDMEGVPGMVQEAGKSVCAHFFRVCGAQDSGTVETAIKEAQDTCADGTAGECAAAWDSVRAGSPSVPRVDVVEHGLHRDHVLQG